MRLSACGESVTALVKGKGGDLFTLKGANAQTGPLKLIYNGSRPSVTCKQAGKIVPCDPAVHGYNPMKLQGAIILGRCSVDVVLVCVRARVCACVCVCVSAYDYGNALLPTQVQEETTATAAKGRFSR